MTELFSLKIEKDLVDKAQIIAEKKDPLRYKKNEIKRTEAVREALIEYIKLNIDLLNK